MSKSIVISLPSSLFISCYFPSNSLPSACHRQALHSCCRRQSPQTLSLHDRKRASTIVAFYSCFMRNFLRTVLALRRGQYCLRITRSSVGANTPDSQNLCATKQTWRNQNGGPWASSPSRIVESDARAGAWRQSQESCLWGCSKYPHIPGRRRLTPPTRVAWGPERTLTLCF